MFQSSTHCFQHVNRIWTNSVREYSPIRFKNSVRMDSVMLTCWHRMVLHWAPCELDTPYKGIVHKCGHYTKCDVGINARVPQPRNTGSILIWIHWMQINPSRTVMIDRRLDANAINEHDRVSEHGNEWHATRVLKTALRMPLMPNPLPNPFPLWNTVRMAFKRVLTHYSCWNESIAW